MLAEAVQELFPGTQVTIGPVIENGFYYDFYRSEPFTPEDLPVIEKKMKEIIARDKPIVREVWSRSEALDFFEKKGEAFKGELIESIPGDEDLSIYKQGDWLDLCRGPHLTSTGKIGTAFKLMKVAGAYWRGDSNRPMLSRIYGTAWTNQQELDAYLHRLEEAERRDHRRLGREMDLFHFQEEGPGTIFWHPKGWTLFQTLISYMRRRQQQADYIEVNTPQVLDRALWETSGHWQTYRENMFVTTTEDERVFALKPMNCPGHVQIFKNGLKSYRDLPMKICEFGIVHRYEPSGALHGVMRVRAFTQDDAHIFCTEEQIMEEALKIDDMILSIYRDFGFDDVVVKLSTRPEKRVGSDEAWDKAEAALTKVLGRARAQRTEDVDPAGRGRVLRAEARIHLARRDRPRMAVRHDAGRLQPARTVRRVLHRRGFGQEDAGHDPSRDVRLARTLHRHPDRALRRPSAAVAVAAADRGRHDHAGGRRLRAGDRGGWREKGGCSVEADLRNEKINYKVREHSLAKVAGDARGRSQGSGRAHRSRSAGWGSQAQQSMTLDEALAALAEEARRRTRSGGRRLQPNR